MEIGPQIPDHLKSKFLNIPPPISSAKKQEDKNEIINDVVANNSEDCTVNACYGPALPPDLLEEDFGDASCSSSNTNEEVGPKLPEDENQEFLEYTSNVLNFERKKLEGEMNTEKREEWMTELPSKLKNYGLGARQFSKKSSDLVSVNDDGSAWTKKPQATSSNEMNSVTTSKKEDLVKEQKRKFNSDLDKSCEKQIEQFNKRNKRSKNESLLDLHAKKLQRQKDEAKESSGDGKLERRPFDREKDLKIYDPSKSTSAKQLAEKARNLSSRFSHAGDRKYL